MLSNVIRKTASVLCALSLLFAVSVSAEIHTVEISNFQFSPSNTTVAPGDTVRWVLVSGFHTSTSDVGSSKIWDSGNMSTSGQEYDLVFEAAEGPGPFPYLCSIHPTSMKDTIFVLTEVDYICGDANGDMPVNVSDAVYLINFVFTGGDAPDPLESGEVNCDSSVNVSDAVYIINFVFTGGNNPCDTSGDDIPDC